MDKYKNKYRSPSARLQNWDYRNDGIYFITICTKDRKHFFGDITNHMNLNKIGHLAEKYWMEIPNHFPHVELGNFVVMPNHVHGILIIDKTKNVRVGNDVGTLQCNVPTGKNDKMAGISPKPGSVSTIIRSYKSVVSKYAHLINIDFAWQTRFYDSIIRDAQSFERVQNYIANNPSNWQKDQLYEKQ